MNAGDRLELATQARAGVASAISLLERPTLEALHQSAAEFSAATERMRRINEDASGGSPRLRAMLEGLRKDLGLAGVLLRHAWEFRAGLAGQIGYTRTGELQADPTSTGRWAIEG